MTTLSAHHGRGLAALAFVSVLWSTGGLLIKSLPLTAMTIAGGRSAIAALVIYAWVRHPKPTWSGAQIGSIVSYMFTVVLFVIATKLTTAANAILLQYSAPIWVALLSAVVARERLTKLDVAAVVAVVAGISVFFIEKVEAGSMAGNIIAAASGVAFACVALFMRRQNGKGTAESILYGNMLTAVVCLPFMEAFPVTTKTVMLLMLLGVVQLGVSYVIYAWAIKHVTALEAILITMLEPLLNPLWVVIAIGEAPSAMALIGGAIVVTAVIARGVLLARRT